ncbi:MAG: DUF1761 domain-containing protein [Bacteroidetes bacterium]|nr:MAG: DUF1761 domain-containing protein [Bacteroidota bacterium]
MELNWITLFGAALIPLVVGAAWYNPKMLGTMWMRESGVTEESMKGANMAMIFGVSYLLSLFLALALIPVVVHQAHLNSIFLNEPGFNDPQSEVGQLFSSLMGKYGNNFRTFRHGSLHGALAGFLIALPVLGINALFERKNFKYIAINAGYWIVTTALMGGVICAYL